MNEYEMYKKGLSIPDVHKETGIPLSTLRFRFKRAGILRNHKDAADLAASQGKLGAGWRGKKRRFSDEHKKNIAIANREKAKYAKGITLKPSGYVEYTTGEHKHRSVHVVLMERTIGRRLYANECVHHIDGCRSNNDISNLQLMTRSEHVKLHWEQRKNAKRSK